jgi:hypothetical protein
MADPILLRARHLPYITQTTEQKQAQSQDQYVDEREMRKKKQNTTDPAQNARRLLGSPMGAPNLTRRSLLGM